MSKDSLISEYISNLTDAIAVMCRLRPIVKDDGGGEPAQIQLSAANDGVVSLTYRGRLKTFEVNHVLDSSASQERVSVVDHYVIYRIPFSCNCISNNAFDLKGVMTDCAPF